MSKHVTDLTHWITFDLDSYRLEKCPFTGLEEVTLKYFDKTGAQYTCTYVVDFESPRFEIKIGEKVIQV